jgi:hypothetical protein
LNVIIYRLPFALAQFGGLSSLSRINESAQSIERLEAQSSEVGQMRSPSIVAVEALRTIVGKVI